VLRFGKQRLREFECRKSTSQSATLSTPQVKMSLRDYAAYASVQHDEEPLYIFDPTFGESAPPLLVDYTVPPLFGEDFLELLGEELRPPFRWLVLGPPRSGAAWHVDPSLTSAWNALLTGKKRWAFYPPGQVPPGVTLRVSRAESDWLRLGNKSKV
jgi:hypothetical protein